MNKEELKKIIEVEIEKYGSQYFEDNYIYKPSIENANNKRYKSKLKFISDKQPVGGAILSNDKHFLLDYKSEMILVNDAVWCEYDREWCHKNEAIWVENVEGKKDHYTIPKEIEIEDDSQFEDDFEE